MNCSNAVAVVHMAADADERVWRSIGGMSDYDNASSLRFQRFVVTSQTIRREAGASFEGQHAANFLSFAELRSYTIWYTDCAIRR
jgi:hypothetical protein